jgi:xylulokinase
LGIPIESVRASGGGARSEFWRQMLADILAKRIVSLASQEGSAYGAALLAIVGTGAYSTVPEICKAVIHEVASREPNQNESSIYAAGHRVYQSLYPALKPFYHTEPTEPRP